MEFIFSIAVLYVLVFPTVLCVGSQEGVENTLIWPLLSSAPQHQGCLSNIPPLAGGWRWARSVGGDTAGTADPNCPKGHSTPQDICSAIKVMRKEEDGGHSLCLSEQPLCALKPCFPGSGWTWPADGKKRMNLLWFPLLPCVAFPFPLLNCLYLDPSEFFPPYFLPILFCQGGKG